MNTIFVTLLLTALMLKLCDSFYSFLKSLFKNVLRNLAILYQLHLHVQFGVS